MKTLWFEFSNEEYADQEDCGNQFYLDLPLYFTLLYIFRYLSAFLSYWQHSRHASNKHYLECQMLD